MKKLPKLIVIIGATATGKTKSAVSLARSYNGEIISADSRQLYRGMDLGTGKDLEEYGRGADAVPYHLIDIADPSEQFDLKGYQALAYKAIDAIIRRGKLPILVGGSGLYLQAVVDGYALSNASATAAATASDLNIEEIHKRLGKSFVSRLNDSEKKNKRRLLRYLDIVEQSNKAHAELHQISKPRYDCLVIGLDLSIETIRKNIQKRLNSRFKAGMIEEVERLHQAGVSWERLVAFGLEYKFIAQYLQAMDSRIRGNDKKDKNEKLKDMQQKLAIASGQFAKRQLTWFRRWEKQGRKIVWLKPKSITKIKKALNDFLDA